MQNKKRTLQVTKEANDDILSIGLYTQTEWGDTQRVLYLDGLDERLNRLSDGRISGKKRDDIKKGYWSYQYEQHLIFYRINGDNLEIIGVVHQASDYHSNL